MTRSILLNSIPHQKTSLGAVACCGVIVAGFYMGVDQVFVMVVLAILTIVTQEDVAGSFSLSGTVYGILASLFVSLFSIYTKKVLHSV